MEVVPFIEGDRILEIGHGPGHLQRVLRDRQLVAVGIDESAQMGRLAKRNLTRSASRISSLPSTPDIHLTPTNNHHFGYAQINLTRGVSQHLPFPDKSFDTIVSTFPSDYITDPRTLAEAKRCLSSKGRFVVLPVAWPRNPFLDWLFRLTGESPSEALELVTSKFREPFLQADFKTEVQTLDAGSGRLLLVLATNPS